MSLTYQNPTLTNIQNITLNNKIPTAITITQKNGVVLSIHQDGKIEYNCSADEAAELFLESLTLKIDRKLCGERLAKETLYKKLHYIIDSIEGMTKEEIISYILQLEMETHKSLTWVILNEKEFE